MVIDESPDEQDYYFRIHWQEHDSALNYLLFPSMNFSTQGVIRFECPWSRHQRIPVDNK